MCAIFGFLSAGADPALSRLANASISLINRASCERGRDGTGYIVNGHAERRGLYLPLSEANNIIGNSRAMPTTEYYHTKPSDLDQQPYRVGPWAIVHNGTIANDAELRTNSHASKIDSAAIAEVLAKVSHENQSRTLAEQFEMAIRQLRGSFAILAVHRDHPNFIFYACNYKPIWYAKDSEGNVHIASTRKMLRHLQYADMIEPYTLGYFISGVGGPVFIGPLRAEPNRRALVVASGGLDSTVAAKMLQSQGYEVELVHFAYNCHAEQKELKAVADIAKSLNVKVRVLDMSIYGNTDSALLDDRGIADGVAGAEYAHEWVPARNLNLLARAVAIAEAENFSVIALGNNLEESGAYPDNEPEFINRFNKMLNFAVGDGKNIRIEMPVGNLMKHEIVAEGHKLGAPMHLTWSCYRNGDKHCGHCGPCFMRKTAFEINRIKDPISYENNSVDTQES